MEDRITESDLVLPSLYLMSRQERGFISTSALIELLEQLFQPTGLDAQILAGRNDTYFSQKVRNLKSHSTFERSGYAEGVAGGFLITEEGRALVNAKQDVLQYIFTDKFNVNDVIDSCHRLIIEPERKVIPLQELISEGECVWAGSSVIRTRSAKLRAAALEHFTHNGHIYCDCCHFEFPAYYGAEYGKSCIEIHHIKPLFSYEDTDVDTTIGEALANLLPVCPNCHRVIHKYHIDSNSIDHFKAEIAANGIINRA